MNVNSVKALCMVSSAALSAGLAFVLWNFFQGEVEKKSAFDSVFANQVLNKEVDSVAEIKRAVNYTGEVKPGWIDLDWTGAPPPDKPAPVIEAPVDTAPKHISVSELVAIVFIRFDTDTAEGSLARVRYLWNGADSETQRIKVGDKLPRPHQNVEVSAIFPSGVEFSFPGTEREVELLEEIPLTENDLIHVVSANGEILRPRRPVIASGQVISFRPEETTKIGQDRYRLGTQDMTYLGDNYHDVLTRDLSTRTHYDESGRRSGIELTSVRKGSIAARHGAQEGDIVKSVNGHPVSSSQEAIKYAKNNKDRYSTWEVVVENLGKERTLTFETPSD